ncbi:ABC transporter substrate-binding protein [Fictibacillus enclensis]|uniref:ABC transporter substrate-binding protein n=1 Tax=Fictibacillus enclensis TaxID=1017270 RepID=UPI0024BF8851|nr:extracellular solute-binding protein [Fictibacillus enclensis]WHY73529.1 extracellular solute-binding protein [Fictibacillus enclensis]
MKKKYAMLMAVLLCLSVVLAGCSDSKKSSGNQADADSEKDGKKVTITYSSWADPAVEKRRIDAFMKAHPNIEVKMNKAVTWPWDEKLAAAAAANKLPDVFFVFSVPPSVTNGWLEDLTPYLKKDKDYSKDKVFGNLTETAEYNGKQYALPQGLYANGIFVNKDLFKKENVELPKPDWTINEMREKAVKLTKVSEKQYGFDGVGGLRETLIPQLDPSQGWLTWDGEKYNFDKPAFVQSNKIVTDMLTKDKVSAEILPQEERDKEFGKGKSSWNVGKAAMRYGGSSDFGWQSKELKFDWDFLPMPKDKGQRTPLVTDYIGMAKSSKHKEAAFELVKWMTYSKEGWESRIEVEKPITSFPLINDKSVWEKYLNSKEVPAGMKNVVPMISDGFVDGWKWLPGYQEVMNKIVGNNYEKFVKGEIKPEDISQDLQKRSNQAYEDAKKKMDEATK